MTPDQMLKRSSLVFVGVIEKHHLDPRPFPRLCLPGMDSATSQLWKIMRREVRVETVLRGTESRKVIDVYEFSRTGGTAGDWNSTRDGERALFLVRVENGRYHVVRDWSRSIFPVTSGPHRHLPLDDSRPLWERIALMNFWIEPNVARIPYPYFHYNDPGQMLSRWRTIKLERGLVRHPSQAVRMAACSELISSLSGWGQDECWDALTDSDRATVPGGPAKDVTAGPNQRALGSSSWWTIVRDRDSRRILTTVSNRKRRAEFCALYEREYPGDHDNGCPADQPPPATIVTEHGDMPLAGAWPSAY
jgi:hypothetical protein